MSYTYHLSANATRPKTTSKVTVVDPTIIILLLLANWGSPARKNQKNSENNLIGIHVIAVHIKSLL